MQRVIVTSSGTVTLCAYVKAWKAVKAAPVNTMYKSTLCTWWPESREEILRQFMQGLNDRINGHIAGYAQGRKWSRDWFMSAWRLSRAVNTPRLIVRRTEVPMEFRDRLAGRLYDEE